MLTGDFAPAGSAGFVWSFLLGVVLLGLGWGVVIVAMLGNAFRLRRLQAHENAYMHERATWRLSPGPSRVVHGRVQVEGADVAVEVDIHQRVENRTSKNARWHIWKESFRQMRARTFNLAHRDGATILVEEEGNDVFVVDSLTTAYPQDKPSMRVRSATVRQDEEVFVYGDLHGGPSGGAYRGGSTFVLRPPRGKRILVATEAMRDRYRQRVRHLSRAGLLLAVLFCVVHVVVTMPFVLAAALGKEETATVINARTYVTHGKGGPHTHYVMTARASDGFTLEGEVSRWVYASASRSVSAREPLTVPMVRTSDWQWASYLGSEAHISIVALLFGIVFAITATAIALERYRYKLAWYDRKTLVEHGGSDHWIETRTVDGRGPPIDPLRD
jgi:hypothetical protein